MNPIKKYLLNIQKINGDFFIGYYEKVWKEKTFAMISKILSIFLVIPFGVFVILSSPIFSFFSLFKKEKEMWDDEDDE